MIDLKAIGLSEDVLQERVIDAIVDQLMHSSSSDEDGETWRHSSRFKDALDKRIVEVINAKVYELSEVHIMPGVGAMIEGLVLQQTNQWGEKQGKPLSFIEYLIARANKYMTEDVDSGGLSAEECRSSGRSFCKSAPRISYAISKHLQSSIDVAMKKALADANSQISIGIEKSVKQSLDGILSRIKTEVKI